MVIIETLGVIILFQSILFGVALAFKRNDVADVGWGLGFSIAGLFVASQNQFSLALVQIVLIITVALWSLRLSGYLFSRMLGKSEDERYATMRHDWGAQWVLKTYLYVFLLQGVLMWVLAGPFLFHLSTSVDAEIFSFQILGPLGLSWLGLIYESVADYQKSKFKEIKSNSGAFIQTGLFSLSRYPQYFGEIIFWTGIAAFNFKISGAYLLLAPILLCLLLLKFSGVPLLEKKYILRVGYLNYAKNVPLILPSMRIFVKTIFQK